MTKHHHYYQLMKDKNQELFDRFTQVHHQATLNPDKLSPDFHQIGLEVLDTIRFWERKLCSGMERGKFAQFSSTLSDKYWQLVRKEFSLIDKVGVINK